MNKIKLLIGSLTLLCFVFLSSCVSVKEEIWPYADGSGKYHLNLDMSSALEFIEMMSSMEDAGDESEDQPGAGPEGIVDNLFDRIEDGTFSGDTIISGKDLIAEARAKGENPNIPENMNLKFHYDKEERELDMTFMIDYKSLKELNASSFFSSEDSPLKDLGGGAGLAALEYTMDKKKFVRDAVDMSNESMGLGDQEKDNLDMMMGMFGDTKFTSVYHLPRKVKSVNHPDAVIDGKTVTIEYDMKDLMKKKKMDEVEIIYKRKKFLGIF